MPTLEVKEQTIQPKVTPGLQLPAGTFTEAARAAQYTGQKVKGFAQELAELGKKIARAEEQDQYDDAFLEHRKSVAAQNADLATNLSEANAETFVKRYDEETTRILGGIKSKGALKRFTQLRALRRIEELTKYEVNFRRLRVAEGRRKIPILVNEYAQEFATGTPEEQTDTIGNLKEKLSNDVISGVYTKAETQDIFRRFSMMAVMEMSESDPEGGVEATKSRASLKEELGLTDEMIASLSAPDLDILQEDARKELKYAQDNANAQNLAAIAEVKTEALSQAANGDFAGAQKILSANIGILGLNEYKLQSNNLEQTSEYFGKTGVNWYKITHKPSVFVELQRQIQNGTLTSKAIVYQHTGYNGISLPDAAILVKQIPTGGAESDFRKGAGALMLKELYAESYFLMGVKAVFARETGYRWLEDWSAKNPDATLRQQREEAMRIFFRIEDLARAKKISMKPEDLPGALTKEAMLPGKTEKEIVAELGSVKLQSAPDIRLDDYWKDLTDKQKRDIWIQFEKNPESISRIIEMIKNATRS